MPIVSINAQSGVLEQVCAKCSTKREIQLATLQLGTDSPGVEPNRIDLTPCPCGAREQLFRTWDAHPAKDKDSNHNRHRQVVNGLAAHLKQLGRSHPSCAALHAKETSLPPDHLELPAGPYFTFDRAKSPAPKLGTPAIKKP